MWRETCGRGNVIELENYFEVYKDLRLAEAGVVAGSHSSFSSSSFGAGYQEEELIQMKPQHVGMSLRIRKLFIAITIIVFHHLAVFIFTIFGYVKKSTLCFEILIHIFLFQRNLRV